MDLTEEKAKEVLDFLAQKAGYDGIDIHYDNVVGCWIPCCVFHSNSYDTFVDNIWSSSLQRFSTRKESYAMLLEKMLETSSRGFDVYGGGEMLLPSCSILETILVEMDLEDGLR